MRRKSKLETDTKKRLHTEDENDNEKDDEAKQGPNICFPQDQDK